MLGSVLGGVSWALRCAGPFCLAGIGSANWDKQRLLGIAGCTGLALNETGLETTGMVP